MAPRYIGTFEILERVGIVAYRLALPPNFFQVHPVFHVLMLRKYISDLSYVLQPQSVEVNEDLIYEEEPVAIVDRSLVAIEANYDGQSLMEEQQRGGAQVGDRD